MSGVNCGLGVKQVHWWCWCSCTRFTGEGVSKFMTRWSWCRHSPTADAGATYSVIDSDIPSADQCATGFRPQARTTRFLTPVMRSAMLGNCGLGVKQVTGGAGALYSITGEGVTNSIGGAGVA